MRTIGKYGWIAAVSSARDAPASRAYSEIEPPIAKLARRPLGIVGYFRGGTFGQDDMQEPKVDGGNDCARIFRKLNFDELWADPPS